MYRSTISRTYRKINSLLYNFRLDISVKEIDIDGHFHTPVLKTAYCAPFAEFIVIINYSRSIVSHTHPEGNSLLCLVR